MRNISAVMVPFMLLAGLTPANAVDLVDRTPSPAAVSDLDGNLLDSVTAGHQVILSKTFTNDRNVLQPFVALFEVRNADGITVQLSWQSGIMSAGGRADVAISWVAGTAGTYDVRTLLVSNLTNPVVIDLVESRSIVVDFERA